MVASSTNISNSNSTIIAEETLPYTFENLMMYLCTTGIIGATIQGGVIFKTVNPHQVDEAIRVLVDPNAIQALFLPVLMFSELFRMNTRAFYIVLGQLILLIGPGVLYGAALTGVFSYAIMPSRPLFSWNLSMAFGGMLATTDPIAIIICVNELAAPKRLAALVGGESLLNDGTSIVLVTLFLELNQGGTVEADQLILFIFNQLLFSILFGTLMGLFSIAFIRVVRNDSSTLTTFIVMVPFMTYVLSAYYMESSGVLSIVPLGIIVNDFGRGMMIEHVERIERLFDQLAFIATSWLYGLSGFVVGAVIAGPQIQAIDWASLFILYIWINLVRVSMVLTFYPILKYTGYGFSLREAILLSFGGLRGAVGLTLALFIKSQLNGIGDKRSAALVEFFMAGSILLMMINGILAPVLLKKLKLDKKPNESLMEALQQKMAEECTDALTSAGVEYRLAQYLAFGTAALEVQQSRRRFNVNVEDLNEKPLDLVEHRLTHGMVSLGVLIEQRKHLVRAQRQMYEHLLTRGLLSRGAWYMLDRAADAQLERNFFHLDQYRFLVEESFTSKRFKVVSKLQRSFFSHSSSGKLLLYLKKLGREPLENIFGVSPSRSSRRRSPGNPAQPENVQVTDQFDLEASTKLQQEKESIEENVGDGDDSEAWFPGVKEASTRSSGIAISPEEWCYNFALATWGFILAQQDSLKIVDEMFTVTPSLVAFSEERRALQVEILEGCTFPAQFMDAVARYAPKILTRIKRLHALSEAENKLFGCVAVLNAHGLIERMELKKLLKFAEKGLKRIRNCDFELQPPFIVGHQAKQLRENPNFFPFPRTQIVPIATTPRGSNLVVPQAEKAGTPRNSNLKTAAGADNSSTVPLPARTPTPVSQISDTKKVTAAPQPENLGIAPPHEQHRTSSLLKIIQKRIERRRSFSDFDPIAHRLSDGSEVLFRKEMEISDIVPVEEEKVTEPSPQLVTDRILHVDVSRMMEALKLEDSELKRF